jgi:predicted transcriptional regulator
MVLKTQLDRSSPALDKRRNRTENRTPEDHATAQTWQRGEIRRGLGEAAAGDFAKPAEVTAAFAAFRRPRRRPG